MLDLTFSSAETMEWFSVKLAYCIWWPCILPSLGAFLQARTSTALLSSSSIGSESSSSQTGWPTISSSTTLVIKFYLLLLLLTMTTHATAAISLFKLCSLQSITAVLKALFIFWRSPDRSVLMVHIFQLAIQGPGFYVLCSILYALGTHWNKQTMAGQQPIV